MADATVTQITAPRIIRIEMTPRVSQAPIPLVPVRKPFVTPKPNAASPLCIDPDMAREAAKAKRSQWAALTQHQEWADAAWMRGHLRMAGLRITVNAEPATVNRMKAKLRRIGVQSPEIQGAIGMPLARFLKVNPRLPLWAALALVLESIGGRFTPEMGGGA